MLSVCDKCGSLREVGRAQMPTSSKLDYGMVHVSLCCECWAEIMQLIAQRVVFRRNDLATLIKQEIEHLKRPGK